MPPVTWRKQLLQARGPAPTGPRKETAGVAVRFGGGEEVQEVRNEAGLLRKAAAARIIKYAHDALENTRGSVIATFGIFILLWTVIKLLGNIDLFLRIEGCAGALLTVAQGGIKDQHRVAMGNFTGPRADIVDGKLRDINQAAGGIIRIGDKNHPGAIGDRLLHQQGIEVKRIFPHIHHDRL